MLPVEDKLAFLLNHRLGARGRLVLEPGIPERFVVKWKVRDISAQKCATIRVNTTRKGVGKPVECNSCQDMVCI